MSANNEAMDRLKSAGSGLIKAAGDKALGTAGDRVRGLTDRLEGIADGGPIKQAVVKGVEAKAEGESPVKGALKGVGSGLKNAVTGKGGKGGGSPKATKSTNIVETIDVGVPVKVAYNQWTEFGAFPSFMKKVENVEAQDENKITWKAQIFLSHRTWEATILEQIPDERIVWRSKGQKGHVDGAVTFHEIGPNLTRILVVLEYYPQGLFEKTGNIWEAQGRRARAEIRHFRRHVMTRTILNQDEVEGWRGRIEDGEVVESHEDALEREQEEQDQQDESGAEDEYDEPEGDEEPEDEYDEPEDEDEYDEGEPEDEYEDEGEPEEGEPEDEYEEPEAEDEYDEPEADEEPEEGEPEDEYEEPEADEEPEDEPEEGEAEDEYDEPEAEEEADDEEQEPAPPRRRSRKRSAA